MVQPPTWALTVSDAIRYCNLRPWQPRLALDGKPEPLPQRVERLRSAWATSRLSDGERAAEFNTSILEAALHRSAQKRVPADPVLGALLELGIELALQNDNVFDFPTIDLGRSLTAIEVEHVTDRLIDVQTRIEHDERIHDLFSEGLCSLLVALLDDLPQAAFDEGAAPFTVPLHALTDPSTLVGRFLVAFLQDLVPETPDAIAALPFQKTRMQLWKNLLAISRMTPEQVETMPHRIVGPKECDLTPSEMVPAYLGGTPLVAFAETPLPFAIPRERRFEHCHILGGTGHGKTQLLQTLMLADFDNPDRPAVVAIDSQGDMLRTLSRLARFDPTLDDRLVILDPADTAWPLRLNMFDINRERIDALFARLWRMQCSSTNVSTTSAKRIPPRSACFSPCGSWPCAARLRASFASLLASLSEIVG